MYLVCPGIAFPDFLMDLLIGFLHFYSDAYEIHLSMLRLCLLNDRVPDLLSFISFTQTENLFIFWLGLYFTQRFGFVKIFSLNFYKFAANSQLGI